MKTRSINCRLLPRAILAASALALLPSPQAEATATGFESVFGGGGMRLSKRLKDLKEDPKDSGKPSEQDLPGDPMDSVNMENDVLGVRLWGPPTQPTLSIGKADIWDRRYPEGYDRVFTMKEIRRLAMSDKLEDALKQSGEGGYWDKAEKKYDFPVSKPGAQFILMTPFGTKAKVTPMGFDRSRLMVEGEGGKRLEADIWVALSRSLVVLECRQENLEPGDLSLRVYRHRDTSVPGGMQMEYLMHFPQLQLKTNTDFEQMVLPSPFAEGLDLWGISQDFPAEPTFPTGFRITAAMAVQPNPETLLKPVQLESGVTGLGTPLVAKDGKEGKVDHLSGKHYKPINEAAGAAATAQFAKLPTSFTVFATLVTTQDAEDKGMTTEALAAQELAAATKLGVAALTSENEQVRAQHVRTSRAMARADGKLLFAAPEMSLPSLRKPGGYYHDLGIGNVGSAKFQFQDFGFWHNNFTLNEGPPGGGGRILTLGLQKEVLSYCDMIRTMLPQAQENARDIYDLPGAMFPLVHYPLRLKRGLAKVNQDLEQGMCLNGGVTKPLWLYYLYTGDKKYLEETAYPVLREGARFMAAYCAERPDGKLEIVPTVSQEHWMLTNQFKRNRNEIGALTLTRYLFNAAASAADILGVDAAEAASWRAAAGRLVPFPTTQTDAGPIWVDVEGAPNSGVDGRGKYNVGVWGAPVIWGDEVGLDSPPELIEIARRTLENVDTSFPWYLAHVGARLGIYGKCDGLLSPENLLLSYQSIHLFPAVPDGVEFVMENFAAQGGFLVSAKRTKEGQTTDVRITSNLGGKCRLSNPWPGKTVEVLGGDGKPVAVTAEPGGIVNFPTTAGQTYSVRPAGG